MTESSSSYDETRRERRRSRSRGRSQQSSSSVELNPTIVFFALLMGVAIITFIGLFSAFVARPKYCLEAEATTTAATPFPPQTSTAKPNPNPIETTASTTTKKPNPPQTTRQSQATTQRTSKPTSTTQRQTRRTTTTKRTPASTLTTKTTTRSPQTPSTTKSTRETTTTARATLPPTESTTLRSTRQRTLPSTTSRSTPSTPGTTDVPDLIRLPDGLIKPRSYTLRVNTFFSAYNAGEFTDSSDEKFNGTITMVFDVTRNSDRVVFHAASNLDIVDFSLRSFDTNREVNVSKEVLPYELVALIGANVIPAGEYRLTINYQGDFGSELSTRGLYRNRYEEEGIEKTFLATQFQPTAARRAFPCFDEPALKAIFEITIEHPSNTIALSNWPVDREANLGNKRKQTIFEYTSRMSTYLVALIVVPDDWSYISGQLSSVVTKPLRVWARKTAVQNTQFAVEVAEEAVFYFENEYFGASLADSLAVPPKVDMIALPRKSGAMENWGMVTYSETTLLYNNMSNSLKSQQNIALTISHELAHFWFGNLVTCAWWNDLWLNEAMATFLQYKAVNSIRPKWDILDQFVIDRLIPVMYDDGFETSQTVIQDAADPVEISNLFSSITYSKGASVLFMLENTVGENNFRDGLERYININALGSGTAGDFYAELTLPEVMLESAVTVEEYIETWLLQINYPHVQALLNNNNGANSVVDFKQERFSLSILDELNLDPITSPFGYEWKIYLECRAGAGPNTGEVKRFDFYLGSKEGSLTLDAKYGWIKCNNDFKGFYLTSYDKANFQTLAGALKSDANLFSVGDKTNLLHNTYSLAFKGSQTYQDVYDLSNYLINEKEYVPWKTFMFHINQVASLLDHRPSFQNLRGFSFYLLKELRKDLDEYVDEGNQTQRLLKSSVVEFTCRMQDTDCLRFATSNFEVIPQEYFNNPDFTLLDNSLSPNYRSSVYKYHLQNTNDFQDWYTMYSFYSKTTDAFERTNTFRALSYTRLSWVLNEFIEDLVNKDLDIQSSDFFGILTTMGQNPSGRHQVWGFIQEYYYDIVFKYGLSKSLFTAIKNIAKTFDNFFLLDEVLELFSYIGLYGVGAQQRQQTIDIIINNIFWVDLRELELELAFGPGPVKKN